MRPQREFETFIARRGGVVHTRTARSAGFTTHGIRRALASGAVTRVRTSWLVAPSCDAVVRRCVEVGGRLTCLSAAARMGLWTPAHEHLHVAVAPTSSRLHAAGLRLHWGRGPVPTASDAVVDDIVNVLFHVAHCASAKDALAVWESAIRHGRIDPGVLRRVLWRSDAARALASVASLLSDSGLETHFVQLMATIGVTVRQQVPIAGHDVDALIGERLVAQLDGFAHHQGRDRRRDLRHDAELVLRGYTVLRFDFVQVLLFPDEVITTVALAIAQGLHR